MNKRLREIERESGLEIYGLGAKRPQWEAAMERFTKLVVQECVDRVTSKANSWGDMTGFAVKESILDCANDLKEHFEINT